MHDPVLLSRILFGLTAGFHFLFPPISIGLAWILVVIEGRAWRTGDEVYEQAGRFFSTLFAITFAVGVATGIVLEFEFGMNWAVYSKYVGDIFGAPLAAEALFAFFLESCFLGLYLFGRNRVNRGVLWFSILMVAVGSTVSAFWIIAANSWQQTPTGFVLNAGRAELVSFWEAVFNPSTLPRFLHTVMGCMVTGAFFVIGVSSYLLLKNKNCLMAQKTLKIGILFGIVSSICMAFPTGHEHARQVAVTQPEKFAVLEGVYETTTQAKLVVFGIPQSHPPRLLARVELPIPGLLSAFAYGSPDAKIRGIKDFPPENVPPLFLPFVSFHAMVGLGSLFILLMLASCWMLWRGRLFEAKRFLQILFLCSPLPLIANELGWIAAEVGRQPWIVYGLLRTSEAVSPDLTAGQVWFSLIAFSALYIVLCGLYLFLLFYKMNNFGKSSLAKERAS